MNENEPRPARRKVLERRARAQKRGGRTETMTSRITSAINIYLKSRKKNLSQMPSTPFELKEQHIIILPSKMTTTHRIGTLIASSWILQTAAAFCPASTWLRLVETTTATTSSSSSPRRLLLQATPAPQGEPDDPDLQWQLFQKYHARGSWKGVWTTYDYMGDVIDEAIASVNLAGDDDDDDKVSHVHTIVTDAKLSDCATCFDSTMQTKDLPVAEYTKDTLLNKKIRCAANSLVIGPTLLRSGGVMAMELVLSQGDARLRTILQYAPVWEQGIEPGSCPPQGLKLARTLVSRECLRDAPPTAETEAAEDPAAKGNPVFYRPVSPFKWHKVWGGTSWTWGPTTGNRGWSIENLQEGEDWHGNSATEFWNLRLPGGVFVQTPRLITDIQIGLCRLAWLPDDDTLLRVEAGVSALQPMLLDDDTLVGFQPPSLASLRCDVLKNLGDLEGEPMFIKDQKEKEAAMAQRAEEAAQRAREVAQKAAAQAKEAAEKVAAGAKPEKKHIVASSKAGGAALQSDKKDDDDDDDDATLQAIRDAIQL